MRHSPGNNTRRCCPLAVVCAACPLAPTPWPQNLTGATVPNHVNVGNPFTVTLTSTSNSEVAITFSVQNCPGCFVVPATAIFAAGSQSQTFTVTIFGSPPVPPAPRPSLTVIYENKDVSSSEFD